MRCPLDWEVYRVGHWADKTELGDGSNGCLLIPKRGWCIVFSNGDDWEHVSLSLRDRCPTWDEMEEVKRRFWSDEDTVMQLHVPPREHINRYPYCLHLWRPMHTDIPRPPSDMVG